MYSAVNHPLIVSEHAFFHRGGFAVAWFSYMLHQQYDVNIIELSKWFKANGFDFVKLK